MFTLSVAGAAADVIRGVAITIVNCANKHNITANALETKQPPHSTMTGVMGKQTQQDAGIRNIAQYLLNKARKLSIVATLSGS